MAKPENTKKVTTRGAGFPVLSLPQAVNIIREAGPYGKVHSHSALATYAGHKSASSGPWRLKEAALRDWGLMVTVNAEKIGLTDRALRIAFPDTAEQAQEPLLECFVELKLYMDIYNELTKGRELDLLSIGNKALTGHGIAHASKEKFINSFVDSAVAVGLAERIGVDKVKLFPMAKISSEGDSSIGESKNELQQTPNDPMSTPSKKQSGSPVMHQVWAFDGGEVTLSISSVDPLQAKTYKDLAELVTAIETFVKPLTSNKVETDINVPSN